jgi:ABC-type nickel/cobalt efflux system permease component RcnA
MNLVVRRLRGLRIVLASAISLWLVTVTGAVALAHPAPSVLHDYIVSLTPKTLAVVSYLRISPELVPEVYRQIDTNGDGQTSNAEWQTWIKAHPSKLAVTLDGVALQLTLSAPSTLSQQDLLVSISHPVVVTYTYSSDKVLAGKHRIRFTYGDNYLSYDEYYVSVAGDLANGGQSVGISRPTYPATYQVVYQMPDSTVPSQQLSTGELAPAPWSAMTGQSSQSNQSNQLSQQTQGSPSQGAASQGAPGKGSAPAVPAPAGSPASNPSIANTSPSPITELLDTLRNWHGEIWAALGMIMLALGVGALHALGPGHGKTMVAAYLVGSRGRVRDAALLGGIVTITHTAGVFALGLALLLVSNFVVPRVLTPALELLSGLLVVVLGAYLLARRWRDAHTASGSAEHSKSHSHSFAEAHSHHTHELAAVPASTLALATASSSLPVRRAGGSRFVPYSPGRSEFAVGAHSHDHDHDHDHVHPHGEKPEGLKALVGLGVSGGIVPCPDALAILLLAASVSQFGLGLGLVLSFSLGLAGVLIGLGIVLVKMKGVLERTQGARLIASPIWTRWVPLASAAIVVIIGVVMLVSALGNLPA